MDQLNAIFDVIEKFDKNQPNSVAPKILSPTNEKVMECSILFDSYDFGAYCDWSHDLPMLLSMVEAMDKSENLSWSREMSLLLDMVEAIEKSDISLKNQSTPLKLEAAKKEVTFDKSNDWSNEYYLLFGNETSSHSSDDNMDWSVEYKVLFGSSFKRDQPDPTERD